MSHSLQLNLKLVEPSKCSYTFAEQSTPIPDRLNTSVFLGWKNQYASPASRSISNNVFTIHQPFVNILLTFRLDVPVPVLGDRLVHFFLVVGTYNIGVKQQLAEIVKFRRIPLAVRILP